MYKFNIAGWSTCGFFRKAVRVVSGLADLYPTRFTCVVKEFENKPAYKEWLDANRDSFQTTQTSSPFVWLDNDDGPGFKVVGGCDATLDLCRSLTTSSGPASNGANGQATSMVNDNYDPAHGHEFDLVVIGGGSGGLACSKEAKNLGAKVAVLDFVKPSSHGSKWGLGGTCVNVGCIPKKLMHQAALLGESYHDATAGFGWEVAGAGPDAKLVNNWEVMRERVQDHIKGLNFGYRVQLREQGVQYLNKLGKFTGPNTLECIDAKGRSKTITAARFVIAVGGRPTPLSCPGGEFAISSDDLFSLEKSPGKTCVVGAGYVALECAGFIAGLHQGDVTVLVRSIPLRGFDRDIVEKVQSYMEGHKIKIVSPVTPTSIEKLPSGQLQVQFSNGESDTFDTVLCAVGRSADTSSLGLETVGVTTNSNNGKISCKNEQTNVPHVYAIGDVVANAPELTPVAILAGKLLARRLFGDSTEVMNYKDVATAVFTPLEIGTVGLSEEDAITKYGAKHVDSFISSFTPLEWSIANKQEGVSGYAKMVVNTSEDNKILGLHIAAPNAGEIIQGYAVAFKKGLTYQDIIDTVGIHPTVAEEFMTMSVLKSSGASGEKAGC